jgi:cofilin
VFDYQFDTASDGARNKLVFVLWTPETAKIKAKMLYPATKDAMKKALVGIGAELQATDASEISQEAVMEKFKLTK